VFGFRGAVLPPPSLKVDAGVAESVRAREGIHPGDAVVALVPGASSDARSWPIDSSAALIDRCLRQGWSVWLVGGPQDRANADHLAERFPRVGNFTRGPLRDAVLRLAAADAAVAKDGGLLHVAAALDRPTIGLFGATDAWAFAPLNPRCRILMADWSRRAAADARPDGRFVPAPLAAIAVEAVFEALSGALRAAA
jgi:heptosyltransferase-2